MKLRCPHCDSEIPAEAINIARGIGHCVPCNEIIDIRMFATGKAEVAVVEKPDSTRIESYVSRDEIGFIFPPLGLRGITLFFLLFSMLWNGITWTMLLAAIQTGEIGGTLFMIPFVIIGLVTLGIFLFLLKGETALLINRQEVSISRTVFGKSFSKNRAYADLENVSMVECYRQNDVPKYGIGLEFKGARSIKFGANLKESEKQWILYEITRFCKS